MKFRQRIAWLMVCIYLGGTFAFFYYMFEINEHYNKYAVDHVQKYHSSKPGTGEVSWNIFRAIYSHVTDVPLSVWLLILLLPYMQIFLMILACTRAEPRHSWAYLWPGLVYKKYQQLFPGKNTAVVTEHLSRRLTSNGYSNSHTVLHT